MKRRARMAEEPTKPIFDQYDASVGRYRDFTAKVEGLVREMLREVGVEAHTVTSRVKSRESLRGKLARPGREYAELADVTDVAGVRITTYFADDVDRVAECIERWFDVDTDNSTDRRETLDPDRFGYLSMHHVVSFGANREAFPEYGQYGGLKAEIQTRSILQHAWAEIEHDLGYKTREGVPREIRRRFSALAGLLEIADREFRSLRDELREYERDIPERIKIAPQSVGIDKDSLLAFTSKSPTVVEVDEAIAASTSSGIEEWEKRSRPRDKHADFIESQVAKLRVLGLETIQDVEAKLRQHKAEISAFAAKWNIPHIGRGDKDSPYLRGISLFFLAYVLAGQTRDIEKVKEFMDAAGILYPALKGAEGRAEQIIRTYASVSDQDHDAT